MNEPLLSARGLKKSYAMGRRTLEGLRGVDRDGARGEFLALRGASGAGKSTLLHLMGGLDSPNAGEISFNGRNLAAFSESRLTHFRNRRVGFVFQTYHLLPELTALENVCLPARVRALVNEPELLLADEPTGNLDSRTGGEIIALLKSLRAEKQTTLVIATHDANVAAAVPRVMELVDGQISSSSVT